MSMRTSTPVAMAVGVFADFTDQAGRAQTTNLAATGRSHVDLVSVLYFVGRGMSDSVRKSEAVVAFTTQGAW
jgi:hypothetical protein